jgi:hypothetical protein
VRGALEAGFDEAVRDVLPLDALQFLFERRSASGLALADEVLRRTLEEVTLPECVLAAALRLRDEVEAVGDLSLGIPEVASELVGTRERIAIAGLLLEDETLAVADDVTRRRVHQRRIAECLRQRDEVLGSECVRIERLVERRIEVDDAGDIDDRVDGALELSDVDAAKRKADVSVDRDDLLREEGAEPIAMDLAQRLECFAGCDRVPEALLARLLCALPNEEEDLSDLRVLAKQEDPEDLAEEACPTEHQKARALELVADVERGNGRRGDAAAIRTFCSVVMHARPRPYRTR